MRILKDSSLGRHLSPCMMIWARSPTPIWLKEKTDSHKLSSDYKCVHVCVKCGEWREDVHATVAQLSAQEELAHLREKLQPENHVWVLSFLIAS